MGAYNWCHEQNHMPETGVDGALRIRQQADVHKEAISSKIDLTHSFPTTDSTASIPNIKLLPPPQRLVVTSTTE